MVSISRPARVFLVTVVCVAAVVVLYGTSKANYLLFHSLIELIAVVSLLAVFAVFLSARKAVGNGFIVTVGAVSLSVAIAILLPMRTLFSGIESQLFFDLVNPSTLLLALFAGLYFVVLKITSSTRYAAIATFCAFIIAFVLLTYIGTALRGPNWDFYWPWQAWPEHPGHM